MTTSMPRRAFIAVLLCLALPAPAWADHPSAGPDDGEVPKAVENALGGDVTELRSGLYEVDPPRGPALVTHGPDTAADVSFNHGQTLGPGDPERQPICSTDAYYQRVLYAHRAGQPNRLAGVTAQIRSSVRRMNAVLNEEALATGGITADYEVLCNSVGDIRIDSFSVPSGTDYSSVVDAARAAGFDDPYVDYTIFFDYDHPNYCGVGSFTRDESPGAGNANNTGGDYGISQVDCWNGVTPMHENAHNQGAVQDDAPYSSEAAHCYDENDVMCYADGGSGIPATGLENRCTDRLYFDCGHDSYFNVDPAPGDYLASNWNMGSDANRFIEFDSAWSPPQAPPEPPAPGDNSSPPAPVTDPAPGQAAPDAPAQLANRAPFADTAAPAGGWNRYTIRVPRRAAKLVVKLDCAAQCTDQLDLYLLRRDEPTTTDYECRSARDGSDEACRIRDPRRGTWHIGVLTASGSGGSSYEVVARYRR